MRSQSTAQARWNELCRSRSRLREMLECCSKVVQSEQTQAHIPEAFRGGTAQAAIVRKEIESPLIFAYTVQQQRQPARQITLLADAVVVGPAGVDHGQEIDAGIRLDRHCQRYMLCQRRERMFQNIRVKTRCP